MLWICISFNADPDPGSPTNAVLDPDPGQTFRQCCGAENISFGSGSDSGSAEQPIRIAAPALAPAPAPNKFYKIP